MALSREVSEEVSVLSEKDISSVDVIMSQGYTCRHWNSLNWENAFVPSLTVNILMSIP